MYKILLADDEAIMLDAMRFLIQGNFGDSCTLETAKTGRAAIEAAERFRPDIALVDIQMPGINGLEAMREMRRANLNTVCIVVSAYNRFDYAQEALPLGVMEYLNKPLDRTKFLEVLRRAMEKVDAEQEKRSSDLLLWEKLETASPMIEKGLILSILFRQDYRQEVEGYRQLLGITAPQGFMLVVDCSSRKESDNADPVPAVAEPDAQSAAQIRDAVKTTFVCLGGPMMGGMMAAYVPWENAAGEAEYQMRVDVIEKARIMAHTLREKIHMAVHVGIGSLLPMEEAADSYNEALKALHYATGTVAHAQDLPIRCGYANNYPEHTEKRLFAAVERGNTAEALTEAAGFFDWMVANHADDPMDIRLKTLEFVLDAEHIGYTAGGLTYDFCSRADYLPAIMEMQNFEELRYWFYGKLRAACHNIRNSREESNHSVTRGAQEYIKKHFSDDISLDDVSYHANVSPYYFSKLFKAETGMNFIDYLTQVRIEKAKQLLSCTEKSMKEICREIGYSDPNYFSRSFKKNVGVTPTEYKENA
jgi:two-component system response regulator YesN